MTPEKIEEQIEENIALSIPPRTIARNLIDRLEARQQNMQQTAGARDKWRAVNRVPYVVPGPVTEDEASRIAEQAQIEEQIEESIALSIPPRTIAKNAYAMGFRAGQEAMRERAWKVVSRSDNWEDAEDDINSLPLEDA